MIYQSTCCRYNRKVHIQVEKNNICRYFGVGEPNQPLWIGYIIESHLSIAAGGHPWHLCRRFSKSWLPVAPKMCMSTVVKRSVAFWMLGSSAGPGWLDGAGMIFVHILIILEGSANSFQFKIFDMLIHDIIHFVFFSWQVFFLVGGVFFFWRYSTVYWRV